MNKRVIFHVGPPKTGSSAIQQYLHQHRQQLLASGVLYPTHVVDENGISSGNAKEVCAPDADGRLCLDHQKLASVLEEFYRHPNATTLLLSSESFFRIVDDIVKAVPKAEIICFLRHPVEFQLSIYNQSVKRHGNQKPFTPGQRLNLGQWENILKTAQQIAPAQLHCFAYKNHSDTSNVIADVLSILDLLTPLSIKDASVNESYSFAALELKRWLNQFSIGALQVELDAYLQAASAGATRYRLIPDETLLTYRNQLAAVADKFHQLLPAHDWQAIACGLDNVAGLPYLRQDGDKPEVAHLVFQLRRDKPMLFRALSVVIKKTEGTVSEPAIKALFRLSGPARWFAALPLMYKQLLNFAKQQLKAAHKVPGAMPPASLNNAVKVNNAVVIPQLAGSTPAIVRGGLRAEDLPAFAHHYRCLSVQSPVKTPECATDTELLAAQPTTGASKRGDYYYGGPVFSNFGHFIAESVHRLAALPGTRQRTNLKKVIFLPQRYRRLGRVAKPVLPAHFYDILDYFGVAKSQVQLCDDTQSVESIWVAPQQSLFRSREPISADYREFLLQCEKAADIVAVDQLPKKLYVSRTPFLLRGSFAGETYIEQLLVEHGYTIFRPEKYSVKEQLRHYKSATNIVMAEGAALHVMELMGEITARITVLQRRYNTHIMFRPLLSARCKDVALFDDLKELPSLFVARGNKRAAHGSALSVLLADALKENFAKRLKIHNFDVTAFYAATRQDIITYYKAYAGKLATVESLKALPTQYAKHVMALVPEVVNEMPSDWQELD